MSAILGLLLFFGHDGSPAEAEGADYSLHEWGVFSVPRDEQWAMADLLAEWATFPEFFHGTLPERPLAFRGSVRKPVIWIHSDEVFELNMDVSFGEGRPLIWWPPALAPARGAGWHDPARLMFALRINQAWDGAALVLEHPVADDHWVADLRKVGGAPLFARMGHQPFRRQPETAESFVYYDGLMKAPSSPTVTRAKGVVVLHGAFAFDAHDLMVVDRRDDGLSVAKTWTEVEAGSEQTRVEMLDLGEDDGRLIELRGELVGRLVGAGLNHAEAVALDAVWHRGLLEQPGLSVFYRIPQATYEEWLPLQLRPAPRETVRVGLVLHQHLEPELESRVQTLIEQLGSDGAGVAEAAETALAGIGGAAFQWLEPVAQLGGPAGQRAARILDALEVRRALPKAEEKIGR